MAAGRISGVKRFDVLIDIWAKFVQKRRDWKLEIYGDGEKADVDALKAKIEALRINDFVEIKGSINTIKDKMNAYRIICNDIIYGMLSYGVIRSTILRFANRFF